MISLEFTFSFIVFVISLLVFLYFWYRLPQSPSAGFFQGLLIGHRGSNLSKHPVKFDTGHPENTLAAIKLAMERGVDGIEFDITLSKDGVPVIMHDETVTRMCIHENETSGSNELGSEKTSLLTVNQLKTFRFRADKNTEPQHRIPTLREALDLTQHIGFQEYGKKFKLMIEVKACNDYPTLAKELSTIFDEFDLYERAVVGSFHPWALYCVRLLNPKIVTLLLVKQYGGVSTINPLLLLEQIQEQVFFLSLMTWMPSFLGAGVIGFEMKLWQNGRFNIDRWFERGYILNCWTVNSEKDKEILADQKVSVTTDFLFRSE